MNNFAISPLFNLDPLVKRAEEFEKLLIDPDLSIHTTNISMSEYTYDVAGEYFQNLRKQICEFVGFDSNSFTLLHAQSGKEREGFGYIHRDVRRMCCISIPIYKLIYPIHFYNSKKDQEPVQTIEYSNRYLNLVNVNNLHRIDYQKSLSNESRVMFQINFDKTFDEIIGQGPDRWTVAEHFGYQRIFL